MWKNSVPDHLDKNQDGNDTLANEVIDIILTISGGPMLGALLIQLVRSDKSVNTTGHHLK